MTIDSNNISLGKYLISPLVRRTPDGGYAASVSIRSGRGSATHDRVLRLVGQFPSPDGARCHALAEGFKFIRPRFGASPGPSTAEQGAQ